MFDTLQFTSLQRRATKTFTAIITFLVLVILFTSIIAGGCGSVNPKQANKDYLRIFDSIEKEWEGSVFLVLSPSAIKETIVLCKNENTDIGCLLDEETDKLEAWLEELNNCDCQDKTLMESERFIVDALELEKEGINRLRELMKNATRGVERNEIERLVDEVFQAGSTIESKCERAADLVDIYRKTSSNET